MKILRLLKLSALLLVFSGISQAQSAQNNDVIEACTRLINEYAFARDAFDAERYAATFTEDGEMVLPNQVLKGRPALIRRINEARGKTFDRHLVTSIDITPIDEITAKGISYFMVFQAPGSAAEALPVTEYKLLVLEYHDDFKLTDEGWRFSRRSAKMNFMTDVNTKKPDKL